MFASLEESLFVILLIDPAFRELEPPTTSTRLEVRGLEIGMCRLTGPTTESEPLELTHVPVRRCLLKMDASEKIVSHFQIG